MKALGRKKELGAVDCETILSVIRARDGTAEDAAVLDTSDEDVAAAVVASAAVVGATR